MSELSAGRHHIPGSTKCYAYRDYPGLTFEVPASNDPIKVDDSGNLFIGTSNVNERYYLSPLSEDTGVEATSGMARRSASVGGSAMNAVGVKPTSDSFAETFRYGSLLKPVSYEEIVISEKSLKKMATLFPVEEPFRSEKYHGEEDKSANAYSHLFMSPGDQGYKESLEAFNKGIEEGRRAEKARLEAFVSDENKRDSMAKLGDFIRGHGGIAYIFDKYKASDGRIDYKKAIQAVREDDKVRYPLAGYLHQLLDENIQRFPSKFGKRVLVNQEKTDDLTGRAWAHSRDYVVYLALAMLGGRFDKNKSDSRPIEEGSKPSEFKDGHHRRAAEKILGDPEVIIEGGVATTLLSTRSTAA